MMERQEVELFKIAALTVSSLAQHTLQQRCSSSLLDGRALVSESRKGGEYHYQGYTGLSQ